MIERRRLVSTEMSSIDPHAAALFATYQNCLNTSDLKATLALYEPTGVILMPHKTPSIGHAALEETYRELYALVDHHVEITVEEATVAAVGQWAFARTACRGKTVVRATGEEVADAVQQLWVLKAADGGSGWRISHYAFSQMGEEA